MSWRLAESLKTLRNQINSAFPARSKISDGTVGDKNHSSRSSDHNPDVNGIVRAWDCTHDPARGVDCHKLAKALQDSKDARIKYLIWNGQITQKGNVQKWKAYTGKNAHRHHLHISVSSDAKLYDDPKEWNLSAFEPSVEADSDTYTVVYGDTVGAICKRFGLSMKQFYVLNNFTADNFDADNIRVGDRFKIR